MEAYGIISSALEFIEPQRLFVFKLVSDHYEPNSLNKESVLKIMQDKNRELQEIIKEIQCQQPS